MIDELRELRKEYKLQNNESTKNSVRGENDGNYSTFNIGKKSEYTTRNN